jgi:hypothetical protein
MLGFYFIYLFIYVLLVFYDAINIKELENVLKEKIAA